MLECFENPKVKFFYPKNVLTCIARFGMFLFSIYKDLGYDHLGIKYNDYTCQFIGFFIYCNKQ